MSLIVQKFGGTSVANTERLKNVADIVTKTAQAGNQVVVVVSAQGDTTDDLIVKAAELNDRPSKREMDVLLNTGEMISMSLLAMAIQKLGFPVVSLTGWQIGLETNSNYSDARIKRIAGERLKAELDNGRIVIVAGFQGINRYDDVTTLGRGGSDTSAVALAAALGADLCQIYTDVDGVYTADPRTVKGARKALEAGASGIVVSNHGGRVLDQCPATAEVLPAIADAVGGQMKIFVDGGIRTGLDVLKALALGADGVLIGRPFVTMVYGGAAEGVDAYVRKLTAELRDGMAMCGVHSLDEITREIVFRP